MKPQPTDASCGAGTAVADVFVMFVVFMSVLRIFQTAEGVHG